MPGRSGPPPSASDLEEARRARDAAHASTSPSPSRRPRGTSTSTTPRGRPATAARTVSRFAHQRRRRASAKGGAVALGLFALSIAGTLLLGYVHTSHLPPASASQLARARCPPGFARNASTTPRRLLVVAAGGTRSGSTVLYNALRILLRVRDPNSVAGWHADLTSIADRYSAGGPGARTAAGDALRVLRETSTVLVKVHVLAEWFSLAGEVSLKDAADAVFASHRDVREVVASLRRLGWARPVTAADLARADFCARPARRTHAPLHDAAFGRTDAWVLAARAHIRCRDALMDDAGGALKADLPASKLSGLDFEAAVALLRELGQHLDYVYSYDELAVAARELVRLEPPGCVEGDGAFMELNPVTHLHRGHVKGEREGDERDRRGMKAIGEDKISSEWLVRLGYKV